MSVRIATFIWMTKKGKLLKKVVMEDKAWRLLECASERGTFCEIKF